MEALFELKDVPKSDKIRISKFYDQLMTKYFVQSMMRFIDGDLHKNEFIRGVYTVIADIRSGEIINEDSTEFIDNVSEEVESKVHFIFNTFEGESSFEPHMKIVYFVRNFDKTTDEEYGWYAYPFYDPLWFGPAGWYDGYYWDGYGWYNEVGGSYFGRGHPNYHGGEFREGNRGGEFHEGNRGGEYHGGNRGGEYHGGHSNGGGHPNGGGGHPSGGGGHSNGGGSRR